jgi:hypothetical protein
MAYEQERSEKDEFSYWFNNKQSKQEETHEDEFSHWLKQSTQQSMIYEEYENKSIYDSKNGVVK